MRERRVGELGSSENPRSDVEAKVVVVRVAVVIERHVGGAVHDVRDVVLLQNALRLGCRLSSHVDSAFLFFAESHAQLFDCVAFLFLFLFLVLALM